MAKWNRVELPAIGPGVEPKPLHKPEEFEDSVAYLEELSDYARDETERGILLRVVKTLRALQPPRASQSEFLNYSHNGFRLSAGDLTSLLIDSNGMSDRSIEAAAATLAEMLPPFGMVEGVPRGGLRLARALKKHSHPGQYTVVIADDVYTTGKNMTPYLDLYKRSMPKHYVCGAVLLGRGPLPENVTALLRLSRRAGFGLSGTILDHQDQDLLQERLRIAHYLDQFDQVMWAKMLHKAGQGYRGGLVPNPDNRDMVRRMLDEHVAKSKVKPGQEVDIAVLALMLWVQNSREYNDGSDPGQDGGPA